MKNIIEIAIADGNAEFRSLFAKQLTFESCGGIHVLLEAGNGAELLHGMRDHVPQIVLLGLDMPVMDGLQTAHYLRALFPEVILIGFSCPLSENDHSELHRLGVQTFISRDQPIWEVEPLLRRACRSHFSPGSGILPMRSRYEWGILGRSDIEFAWPVGFELRSRSMNLGC